MKHISLNRQSKGRRALSIPVFQNRAPLSLPRLAKGAVPCILPGCPLCLSSPPVKPRKSREEKIQEAENASLSAAIELSNELYERQREEISCYTLADITKKFQPPLPWESMQRPSTYTFYQTTHSDDHGPSISCAIHITEDMQASAFLHQVPLPQLDSFTFPHPIKTIPEIHSLMEKLSTLAESESPSTPDDIRTTLTIQLVFHLLTSIRDSTTSRIASVLWFICEQLNLLINSRITYSPDFLIFASIFHNVSPHAYRFLRESGKCILPSYSTIRRVTLSSSMSPSSEQSPQIFLHYIRQKCKNLSTGDKTVILLIDEIHLKPYFDYVGGHVVGAAHIIQQMLLLLPLHSW